MRFKAPVESSGDIMGLVGPPLVSDPGTEELRLKPAATSERSRAVPERRRGQRGRPETHRSSPPAGSGGYNGVVPSIWLLIHNGGSRRGKRLIPRVLARLGTSSLPEGATVRPLDVAALERWRGPDSREPPLDRVVIVGGDGTANAVVRWAIARELDPLIAIVPAGTGNNLARDLGVPLDPDRAMSLALGAARSDSRRVDAVTCEGEFGSRVFVQMAALGFPADVVAWHQALRRAPLLRLAVGSCGSFGYKLTALAALGWRKLSSGREKGACEIRLRLPDERIEERTLALFLGNGPSTGGGFVPCPDAAMSDGLIDLCLVRSGSGRSDLGLFRSFARGRHLQAREAILYRRSRGPVEIELSRPSRFLADGELEARTTWLRLELLPGRLRFVVPRLARE